MNKQWLIHLLKFLLFLGIGLGILYWVYVDQQRTFEAQCAAEGIPVGACDLLEKLWTDFGQVKLFWIGMVILTYLLSNLSRAMRWRMLIEPLGKRIRLRNAFMAMMTGYLINYIVPRAGEVAKCGAIARYEKVPLDQLIGTIVLARSLDVLCFAVVIGLAFLFNFDLLWSYLQEHALLSTAGAIWTRGWFWLGVSVLLLLAFVAWSRRQQLLQLAIFQKLWGIVLGFWRGIKTVSQLRQPALFWGHTVFIWCMYFLMHYVAFFAFEPTAHLTPADGLTIFVFGSLGILIPTPGGLGSYQFLVTTALATFYGIPEAEAFSFSMIVFFPPFICNVLLGFLSLIFLPLLNE